MVLVNLNRSVSVDGGYKVYEHSFPRITDQRSVLVARNRTTRGATTMGVAISQLVP